MVTRYETVDFVMPWGAKFLLLISGIRYWPATIQQSAGNNRNNHTHIPTLESMQVCWVSLVYLSCLGGDGEGGYS